MKKLHLFLIILLVCPKSFSMSMGDFGRICKLPEVPEFVALSKRVRHEFNENGEASLNSVLMSQLRTKLGDDLKELIEGLAVNDENCEIGKQFMADRQHRIIGIIQEIESFMMDPAESTIPVTLKN